MYRELHCPACGFRELCDRTAMIERLRGLKKLRPGREPDDDDVLVELFQTSGPQLVCAKCQSQGLAVTVAEEDLDWPEDRSCAACGRSIPGERVAAMPEVRLCIACQQAEERGESPGGAVEYCPRCGSPMELRLTRKAGVSRFEMTCTAVPACRKR
jgi:hypothetical protein